jgi:hypothetical protein
MHRWQGDMAVSLPAVHDTHISVESRAERSTVVQREQAIIVLVTSLFTLAASEQCCKQQLPSNQLDSQVQDQQNNDDSLNFPIIKQMRGIGEVIGEANRARSRR